MTQTVKLLIVEDNALDAELVLRELHRAGFQPTWKRVDTEADFLDELRPDLDLILSDFQLPQFSGLRALELLTKSQLEIPFIIVSGTIGEETAVAAMKQGAADYFIKDRLTRLGPAIIHALEASRLSRERKLARETLRLRDQALSEVSQGVLICDENHLATYANAGFTKITGYSEAEILGRNCSILQGAETNPETILKIRAALNAGEEFSGVILNYRKDGQPFWNDLSLSPLSGEPGQPIRHIGVQRDVTERIKAQEETLRLAERLTTTLESITDGFFTLDRNWRFTYVNREAELMFKLSRTELLGNYIWDKFPEARGTISQVEYERALRENVAVEFESFYSPLGTWFEARVFPSIQGLAVYFRDITAVRKADETLRLQQVELEWKTAFFEAKINSSIDGIIVVDPQGKKILQNQRLIDLLKIPSAIANDKDDHKQVQWVTDLTRNPDHFVKKVLRLYAHPDEVSHDEIELKDGRTLDRNSYPVRGQDGTHYGRIWTFREITERKRMERALRESEEHFRFLNELAEAARGLTDSGQIMIAMCRMLGEHLQASRCAYAEVEKRGDEFSILHDYTHDCTSSVGNYHLSLFGPRALDSLHRGQTLIIRDVEAELLPNEGADMFQSVGIKAVICCPLIKDGVFRAMMAVHQTTPRDWKTSEVTIIQEVVERCWATIERWTAEESLRQSEALLRIAGRTTHLGGWAVELPGVRVIWSDEVCAIQQVPPGTSLGLEEALDFYAPASRKIIQKALEACLQSGTPFDLELEINTPTKHHAWVRATGEAERNSVGVITRIQGAFQDISDQKRAQKALQKIEEEVRKERAQLRALIDSIPDLIFFKNDRSEFLGCNRAFEKHFGFLEKELLGRTDYDIAPTAYAESYRQVDRELLLSGQPQRTEDWIPSSDGGGGYFETIKTPFFDLDGQSLGLAGVSRDITERKRAAEAMRSVLERLQLAIKASKAGIWDHDLITGKIETDEQIPTIYGVSQESVIQTTDQWHPTIHPDDLQRVKAEQDAALKDSNHSFETEFRIHRVDNGELRFIRAMGVVLRDEFGKPIRVIGINWDVTEERIREKKLAEALAQEKEFSEKARAGERAKSEFLAVMSHEIRTPMNGILGFSELLAASPELPADCRDYAKTITSSGEALLRILDDILDFSRLEAGGLKIEASHFSVRGIIDDIHHLLGPHASERGLTFQTTVEAGTPECLWNDAGRIRQVLLNLVGNAIKFTAKGSLILGARPSHLATESGEQWVEIFVKDTGAGIPEEKLNHIFEPFAQADSSISRKHGGTGLGLTISKQLVQLMGGTLTVRSHPGEGSEFRVGLPVGQQPEIQALISIPSREVLDETFAAQHPLRVLVVEDDRVNLKLMLMMLRKLGYEPLIAHDGVQAVDLWNRESPHCILMDLQMPEKDGLQATRDIREIEEANANSGHTFIAALTANILVENRQQCFAAGMDAYMNKPFKRALLASTLKQASEMRATRR